MSKTANWKEVAAYVLTVERCKKNKKLPEPIFEKLIESKEEELHSKLEKVQGNWAANWLNTEKTKYCWKEEELPLKSLRMGPGAENTKYFEIAMKYYGSPSAKNIHDEIKKMGKNEKDQSILNFEKKEDINPFFKNIVVFERLFPNGNTYFRIGDGYHRAVITYGNGDEVIECYSGYLI